MRLRKHWYDLRLLLSSFLRWCCRGCELRSHLEIERDRILLAAYRARRKAAGDWETPMDYEVWRFHGDRIASLEAWAEGRR